MDIQIGISKDHRQQVSRALSCLLADTYTLYLKTQNYHWNITGPLFHTLHLMFEDQYTDLSRAVDLVAERIRALGFYAPGSYKQFQKLSSLEEDDGVPKGMDMIKNLMKGHETLIQTARKVLAPARAAEDEATLDLLTQRIQTHEKISWMLRSLLEN